MARLETHVLDLGGHEIRVLEASERPQSGA